MQYNHFQIMQIMNKINSKFETLIGQNIPMEGNEGRIINCQENTWSLLPPRNQINSRHNSTNRLYANFQRNFLFLLIR